MLTTGMPGTTLQLELLYYWLQVEDVIVRYELLNKNAIEIGRVFQETGVVVNQLAILDRS